MSEASSTSALNGANGNCNGAPPDDAKTLARRRWGLLASRLRKRKHKDSEETVSTRRFGSLGLVEYGEADGKGWRRVALKSRPDLGCQVRLLSEDASPATLIGPDHTGNVCVWPSEEVLCEVLCERLSGWEGSSAVELGAGMAGLAGFLFARLRPRASVLVTDANPTSVANLRTIQKKNSAANVSVRELRWGGSVPKELWASADLAFGADLLFFDGESRPELLKLLAAILRPGGLVLLVAPGRGGTLAAMRALLEGSEAFEDVAVDAGLSRDAFHRAGGRSEDEDRHLPLLLTAKRTQDE